jgi:hypothetical protein
MTPIEIFLVKSAGMTIAGFMVVGIRWVLLKIFKDN